MLDEKLFRDVIMNLAQNSLAAIKSISVSEKKDVFEQKTSEKISEVIITLTENTAVAANTAAQKPTAKQK